MALLREYLPPIPPAKSQISRSATRLLIHSKKLTNIFCHAKHVTHCKTTIHSNAGFALDALAMSFCSCDRSRYFEQDFTRFRAASGTLAASLRADHNGLVLIPQAVRHTALFVQLCWLREIWPVRMRYANQYVLTNRY